MNSRCLIPVDKYGLWQGSGPDIIVSPDCIGSTADVVKLVYTPDLGSGAVRRESSSLSIRTIKMD